MMKLYTKNVFENRLRPSKKNIEFLLDYSKSIKMIQTKTNNFIRLHLN